ncbi:unnamed protein product, partial [Amoebophrya sp. A120]
PNVTSGRAHVKVAASEGPRPRALFVRGWVVLSQLQVRARGIKACV